MKEDGDQPRGWGEALVSSWMKTTIDVEMGGGTIVERNKSSNGRQRRTRSGHVEKTHESFVSLGTNTYWIQNIVVIGQK